MMSLVIDTLRSSFVDDNDIGVAFYYCQYRENQQQDSKAVRSVLGQLMQQCASSLPHALMCLYKRSEAQKTDPSSEQLLDSFASFFTIFSKTYIVIDAIDELSVPSRRLLLSRFFALQGEYGVNLLFTSREYPDIRGSLETCPIMEPSDVQIKMDISKCIDHRLPQMPAFKWLGPETLERVRASILMRSDTWEVYLLIPLRHLTDFPQASSYSCGSQTRC